MTAQEVLEAIRASKTHVDKVTRQLGSDAKFRVVVGLLVGTQLLLGEAARQVANSIVEKR